MRKPSDLKNKSPFNADHCTEIEEYIDKKIDLSDGPIVRIQNTRSSWTTTEIKHVLDKYRAAGWDVIDGDRDWLAILRPDPQAEVAAAVESAGPGDIVIGGRGHGSFTLKG